jgi:diketogulonate reductase-like aldo/keto reductase
MHWPVAFCGDEKTKDGKPVIDKRLTADPYPTWQKMEEMVEKGKVRNIGVSKWAFFPRATKQTLTRALPASMSHVCAT